MPTWTQTESFAREYRKLPAQSQARFRRAVERFVEDVKGGTFRPGLRVKRIEGMVACFEMTCALDGRAIWRYGDEVRPGEPHIIWLAIGDHSILP